MGLLRFFVDPFEAPPDWRHGHRAFISAYDGRVHPTKVEYDGRVLSCRRQQHESGKLHVPWQVPGRGSAIVSTTSLPEREQPYVLPLELARGKLAEVRDQAAIWQQLRMVLPEGYQQAQQRAFQLLARASAAQSDLSQTCRFAQECLQYAFAAADALTKAYIVQRQATRKAVTGHKPSLLGCRLEPWPQGDAMWERFPQLFSAAEIPIEWRNIEPVEGQYDWEPLDRMVSYALDRRLVLRGGPLIDLGPRGLPEWLKTWENDVLNLPSFVCDYIETAIGRYSGAIRVWEVAAHPNTGGALALSEDHRLALVARILESAVHTQSDGAFFIRIDQPWGEYQARGQHRLSPFQFVDALLRSNLGLTGVNLEIAMAYEPAGSLSRDLLSLSRLIDLWSQLSIQLHVTLACPSAESRDGLADVDLEVESAEHAPWSERSQAVWLHDYLSLLLAKPAVTGVFLSHLDDSMPHRYPHAGLVDGEGRPKAAWEVVSHLQEQAASAAE
ncbi:MAG: endo-1,4-beta-xylanase [Planctomyces sp.]|nr:endo-1,4-beta-xylanase [Planctomyces sp.]